MCQVRKWIENENQTNKLIKVLSKQNQDAALQWVQVQDRERLKRSLQEEKPIVKEPHRISEKVKEKS